MTKEQAENDQALDFCLQQIDECRPYFIGLLGERYGWVPVSLPQDALAHYGWIQNQVGKSVTELEMLYGMLTNPVIETHAFFYFRDPAAIAKTPEEIKQKIYLEIDPDRKRRLAELKERIRASGFPVMDPYPAQWDSKLYDRINKVQGRLSNLHEFGRAIERQLWKDIKSRLTLPDHPVTETLAGSDPLAEEQDYHERFLESRVRVYVGREGLKDELVCFAKGEGTVPCLVTGPSGSGKSAALAHFTRTLQNTYPDTLVIPHFIGASPGSTNLRQMLRRFCLILKDKVDFKEAVPNDLNELVTQFRTLVGKVPEYEKLVFVIDALNQLDSTDNAKTMFWLPRDLPTQVKMVVSCMVNPEKKERVLEAFEHLPHLRVTLEPLTPNEQRAIVRQVPSLSAKSLDERQIDQLLANPATENPLFLLVALEELRGFGSFEELNARIAQFPQRGDTVTTLFTQVIDRLQEDFEKELVRTTLGLLACSRQGLSQRELLELIEGDHVEESSSDLFPIIRQLRPYLQLRGNLLDFYHRNLFKAVRMSYLDDEHAKRNSHRELAAYFHRKADPAQDGGWSGESNRGLSVLPYHLVQGGQWDQLNTTLLDFRFLQAKIQVMGIHPLLDDYDLVGTAVDRDITEGTNVARTLVGEALHLSAPVLAMDPSQLPSQLYGRLMGQNFNELQFLLEQAQQFTDTPWLCPHSASLTPPGGPLIRTLTNHTGAVTAVAVTPDGQWAITGSWDRTVKVWDIARGVEEASLKGSTAGVTAVAVTPDGQKAVTGSWDGKVKVWDILRRVEIASLGGHTGEVLAVAVTPDGQWAITGSWDGTAMVWGLVQGEEHRTLRGHTAAVTAVVITPDGGGAVTGFRDGTVKVWDLARGLELQTLRGHTAGITALALTLDGKFAFTGSWGERAVKVWDITRGVEEATLRGHNAGITAVAVTTDGQKGVTWSWDGTVKIWDWARGVEHRTLRGHTAGVEAVVVTPDGQRAVTGSWDGTVNVWDIAGGVEHRPLRDHTAGVEAIAVTLDGKQAVTGSWDGTVKVWDMARGVEHRTLRRNIALTGHTHWVTAIGVTSDGKQVATGTRDGTVNIWDMVRGVKPLTLNANNGEVLAVAITPDGQQIVTGSADGTVNVWDITRGAEHRTLRGHAAGVSAVAVTPDGRQGITGSTDRTVKVWDFIQMKKEVTLRGHATRVGAVATTPDGQWALSGSWDGTVYAWSVAQREKRFILKGHTAEVTTVILTPDGQRGGQWGDRWHGKSVGLRPGSGSGQLLWRKRLTFLQYIFRWFYRHCWG